MEKVLTRRDMQLKTKITILPIGPLMIEHRLIERVVRLLDQEAVRIDDKNQADSDFLEAAIDFFRFYADKCHHGKEENILFRALRNKRLTPEHARILDELVQEHAQGREFTGKLHLTKTEYFARQTVTAKDISDQLKALSLFYRRHIQKEDKEFFLPAMGYFTREELDVMLAEFYEFDRKVIHERYRSIVGEWEKGGLR